MILLKKCLRTGASLGPDLHTDLFAKGADRLWSNAKITLELVNIQVPGPFQTKGDSLFMKEAAAKLRAIIRFLFVYDRFWSMGARM